MSSYYVYKVTSEESADWSVLLT